MTYFIIDYVGSYCDMRTIVVADTKIKAIRKFRRGFRANKILNIVQKFKAD